MKFKSAAVVLSILSALAISCQAAVRYFDAEWGSPGSSGPGMSSTFASALIGMDVDLISNPGSTSGAPNGMPWLDSISMTLWVNGVIESTYTTSDFTSISFDTGGRVLDFSRELVGQGSWGNPDITTSGEFNLSAFGGLWAGGYPSATWYYTMDFGVRVGNLTLKSFAPSSIPEPATTGLLISGAAIAVAGLRRKYKCRT